MLLNILNAEEDAVATVFLFLAIFFFFFFSFTLCTSVKTLGKWERHILVWVLCLLGGLPRFAFPVLLDPGLTEVYENQTRF